MNPLEHGVHNYNICNAFSNEQQTPGVWEQGICDLMLIYIIHLMLLVCSLYESRKQTHFVTFREHFYELGLNWEC